MIVPLPEDAVQTRSQTPVPSPRQAPQAEAFRDEYEALLVRIGWPSADPSRPLRTLGVTSCSRKEGVSTVAERIATTAALGHDARVLLVDANLAHPSVAKRFGLTGESGLAETLRGEGELLDAIQSLATERLFALAAGRGAGSERHEDPGPAFAPLIEVVGQKFDLVVFDLPPAGEASFVLRLAGQLDGVLLVVEAERVRSEVVQRVQESLRRANATLLGAILNKRRRYIPDWLYRML